MGGGEPTGVGVGLAAAGDCPGGAGAGLALGAAGAPGVVCAPAALPAVACGGRAGARCQEQSDGDKRHSQRCCPDDGVPPAG